jgi:hypothetical protein
LAATPTPSESIRNDSNNNADTDTDTETDSSSGTSTSSSDWRARFRFPNLKRVILRAGGVIESDAPHRIPWPFPGRDDHEDSDNNHEEAMDLDDDDTRVQKWMQLAQDAPAQGAEWDRQIRELFAARGVEYRFDRPEFYFHRYTADVTKW